MCMKFAGSSILERISAPTSPGRLNVLEKRLCTFLCDECYRSGEWGQGSWKVVGNGAVSANENVYKACHQAEIAHRDCQVVVPVADQNFSFKLARIQGVVCTESGTQTARIWTRIL